LHLLLWNFALQNRLADPEGTSLLLRDCVLARVSAIEHVNLTFLANRTESKRLMLRGIDLNRLIVTVLAKIELRLEFVGELHAVAFEIFRPLDDLARELSDVRHEIISLHRAFLHPLEF